MHAMRKDDKHCCVSTNEIYMMSVNNDIINLTENNISIRHMETAIKTTKNTMEL